ncbi:hypothetical protein GCM10010441_13020 [Kitasatospora paracochleata]|uniref:Thiol-disulfide isomerase/thioredoxin n=1 Tax=Kitasatospora paracochleata TaxID=58354 RepID=A0ABT1JBZ3_9ACTN|nr:thioredoxin domain-containing protein [Kitasatospora paracochleata]MCP2314596.1 thiol-disulfide isomerase/thioredoxin [Kitasatospora paracochleata]
MPKRAAGLSARLGLVATVVSLAATACSTSGSGKPVGPVAAPPPVTTATPLVTTAAPEATPSPAIPSPSPSAARINLPPEFDPTRGAWRDIDEALKQAAVDHKPVLLDFGATWCPACKELEQSFQDPKVRALLGSVHRVRVDTGPRSAWTNTDIAVAYRLHLNKTGLPGLVLLSAQGDLVANTDDGLFDNDQPNSPSVIIGFLKPHL